MSQIKVYTSNNCSACRMVKKFLQIKGRDYQELNVDQDPNLRQEAISISGGAMTVPVIAVSDDDGSVKGFSVGYNPAQLSSLLS
ncbi:MAG TPA: glutaredoxin family protein [Candidatus Saccharibacteria bacterium]|jgi:glutaredoxin|nr:glutaredoxin family protein [Candidatus Saccharibacteria bacterium]